MKKVGAMEEQGEKAGKVMCVKVYVFGRKNVKEREIGGETHAYTLNRESEREESPQGKGRYNGRSRWFQAFDMAYFICIQLYLPFRFVSHGAESVTLYRAGVD